ncbi:MAG TPA: TIGR04295 family B12-binding domain-containing radical SAM protein [Polyangia bacterium]|nr:TIGR04295 family B12-binding domain-containing radical SAM protein [Polyangia bacterium]
MRVALVNPRWTYEGSIYFGCREPHLPLELAYARALLEREGHEAFVIDAHASATQDLRDAVGAVAPELVVVATAPTYLFWRCPPPELRAPREALAALSELECPKVAVGPHGSTTPAATLRKLGVDAVVVGECEEALAAMARTPRAGWSSLPSVWCAPAPGERRGPVATASCDLASLPALAWRDEEIARHAHHHHRFDAVAGGPGAEIEASRGCPFACTFCAKTTHRDRYRRRPHSVVAEELDGLLRQGVRYVYFIDEIFLPDAALLELLAEREVAFGVQTRIDLWPEAELERLGRAGCVSIEAGVESVSKDGRAALDKRCRLDTEALTRRLVHAKQFVPFVQATLLESRFDDPADVARWSEEWKRAGLWVNDPVPLFPYPGSPDYVRLWGPPDEEAWERAHQHYLGAFTTLSDIQERRPVRLPVLEGGG